MRYPKNSVESDGAGASGSGKLTTPQMVPALSQSLPSLHRYACRVLGNKYDAEDAVQDALLSALKHLGQFRGEAQFSTWLTTIVLNCARMQLRKRSRQIHLLVRAEINGKPALLGVDSGAPVSAISASRHQT